MAAALQVKIHDAKVRDEPAVTLWGTGTPMREFLYVDDLADALVFMMKHYSGEGHLNVGTGKEISILDLAKLIARIVDYRGRFVLDTSKPDGTPRKVLDVSKLQALGWRATTPLEEGFRAAYQAYLGSAALVPLS